MPVTTLADGRRLAYDVMGDPNGPAVLALHGTPGSSRQLACLDKPARDHKVALILPDRAGYGGSTNDPSRTIASGARDLGQLIEHLQLGHAAVIGLSGGGPTALACGVVLPGRISSVTTVGSVAPLVPRDPSLPPDRLITKTARRSQTAARALLAVMVFAGRRRPEQTLDRFCTLLAEPDAQLLRHDPMVRNAFLDDLRHPSPTTARAAARDFRLFTRRWDIDLSAMNVPVHVWHGTEDRNVPVAHARVIAAGCPTARLHLITGGGHMLLSNLEEIIGALRQVS
jgi:pimeloyl-ACP methyl ester carboxylesterase